MSDFPTSLRALVAEATSGPWSWKLERVTYAECDDADQPSTVYGPDSEIIAHLSERYPLHGGGMVNDKDASLIVFLASRALAIAELAEAAKALLSSVKISDRHDEVMRLRAALAKLEGDAS